jgi:hypothetical protein
MKFGRVGVGLTRRRGILRIVAMVGLVFVIRYGFDGTWLNSTLIPLISFGIAYSETLFKRKEKK